MRSVTPMRAAKTGYIIMSVLLCVLGVVLFTAATGRSFLSSLMGFVTTPVQQISSQAAGAAGAVGPSGKTIEELEAENAELTEKLNPQIRQASCMERM